MEQNCFFIGTKEKRIIKINYLVGAVGIVAVAMTVGASRFDT